MNKEKNKELNYEKHSIISIFLFQSSIYFLLYFFFKISVFMLNPLSVKLYAINLNPLNLHLYIKFNLQII